jgi:anthranilate synthase/aminodeoxychorismate synthase-like glutamine amidotransferase
VLTNDAPDLPQHAEHFRQYAALVISPGPGAPAGAGACQRLLALAAPQIPILGVCLGHQAIAEHFGARVTYAKQPVHGKATPISHDARGIFRNVPNPVWVARYHSLVVEVASLPSCLEVCATSTEGEIMGLRHRKLPIEGIQFHPESILSDSSTLLVHNWLESLNR